MFHPGYRKQLYYLLVSSIIFGFSLQLKSQEFSTFYESTFKQRENQLIDFSKVNNSFTFHDNIQIDSSKFSIKPIVVETLFNSSRPFGYNNASFISAKGLQMRYSLGVGYNSKLLSVNIRPEYLNSKNPIYKFSDYFGQSTSPQYRKSYPAQSSLKLHLWKFDLGAGTENIFWGPGQFNALIMSNNAPGFKHFSISSNKPIKIGIGKLDFQILGGKLENDSLLNSEVFYQKSAPYSKDWRYLSGVNFSYQPVFIPNFYIGFTRTMQLFGKSNIQSQLPFFRKYFPAVSAIFAKKINTQIDAPDQNDGSDQQASFFMRFLIPSSHFEFYTEYGYNDFKANARDFFLDPQHAAAYIIGFKKIFGLKNKDYWILNGEITQMAQSNDYLVRNAGNWYEHGLIVQGLTNKNQILGAGSGKGNNIQIINLNKNFKDNLVGFKIQRIQNDPRGFRLGDLSSLYLSKISWTDLTYGPVFRYNRDKLILVGEIQAVHSKNYAWEKQNLFNFNSYLSLSYMLK